MRQMMVMGNWKMNGSLEQVRCLLDALLLGLIEDERVLTVVFPPAIYIPLVANILADSSLYWGAQNVYPCDSGAFTGELSAPMLKDFACRYVLVGHSERRHLLHEDEKFVAEKFHHAKDHGMIPVLCVGETLAERENGLTEQVLRQQVEAVSFFRQAASFKQCVIAYEPVWAIGTGKTATPEQAQVVHAYIRAVVAEYDKQAAQELSILYGGSVNPSNAKALFEMPDVDGGLVGGASLNAQQFVDIVKCINLF